MRLLPITSTSKRKIGSQSTGWRRREKDAGLSRVFSRDVLLQLDDGAVLG